MNLYLIDGNSYIYRAFYAIKGLTDSKGRPTGAIFGFTNMLLKIIREKNPDAIAVSFDSPEPTERHILFEEYKAQRPSQPDELKEQIPHIRRIINALCIKTFIMPRFEADDILATIGEKAVRQGAKVFIVTGDKDMLQLIHNSIKVYDPMKDAVLDEVYVKERFGVLPSRIPEFMALRGDAVDNIPGVKGIGLKTAKELLKEFESLDELLAHPQRIKKERIRKLIEENIGLIKLSRELSEIKKDVPIHINLNELFIKEPDWQALLALFREFEFTSLIKLIPDMETEKKHYETISNLNRLKELIGSIKVGFSFDIEIKEDSIKGLSICPERGNAVYIPFNDTSGIERKSVIEVLKSVFEDEGIEKTGHDLKTSMGILKKEGISMSGRLYDTEIAGYILNPLRSDYSLENLSFEYLLRKKPSESAELILELKSILFQRIKEEGLEDLYFGIEMPLIYVLFEMESAGLRLDKEKLALISEGIEEELNILKNKIYFLAGEEFNINSPKQLRRVLFEGLGLKPSRKKKTGYSTEFSVLEELSQDHELPKEVLRYRSLFKLKTTYIDTLIGLINPKTGRLHTTFSQVSTATGRLSSMKPNLQNIPIRGALGKRIREAFIAEEGALLISADYSQIELRLLAHLSQDHLLISSFLKDIDIHSETAGELFGISENNVTEDMRRVAKTVNFGVVYGITPFGLSETLNISKGSAEEYIKQYFEKHPSVREYITQTINGAKKKGYVKTLLGRKRPLPELLSKDQAIRQLGERLAINSPIQGTSADIIKIAMISLSKVLKSMRARLILQVHDELLVECPEEEKDKVIKLVRAEMENAVKLSVPLNVEIGWGRNWKETGD